MSYLREGGRRVTSVLLEGGRRVMCVLLEGRRVLLEGGREESHVCLT